jgi:hypothetical protein
MSGLGQAVKFFLSVKSQIHSTLSFKEVNSVSDKSNCLSPFGFFPLLNSLTCPQVICPSDKRSVVKTIFLIYSVVYSFLQNGSQRFAAWRSCGISEHKTVNHFTQHDAKRMLCLRCFLIRFIVFKCPAVF